MQKPDKGVPLGFAGRNTSKSSPCPSFTSKNKGADDPLMGFLSYLGTINREVVIPDDKYDDPDFEPDSVWQKLEKTKNLPDIYDLKIRKIDFLEKNGLEDMLPNLKQEPENFFIKIKGYGRDYDWAKYVAQSANYASLMIRNKASFDEVLNLIADDYSNCSFLNVKSMSDFQKAELAGVSRLKDGAGSCLMTPFDLSGVKYGAYGEIYAKKALNASKSSLAKTFCVKTPAKYPDFAPTRIVYYQNSKNGKLVHTLGGVEPSLRYSREIYDNLVKNYTGKKLNKKEEKEAVRKIAAMHWLLTHGVPYFRGSDAIINIFIKSLFNALGFELKGPKEGVSFDLEAYCSELNEYVKKYPSLYESEPKYVL